MTLLLARLTCRRLPGCAQERQPGEVDHTLVDNLEEYLHPFAPPHTIILEKGMPEHLHETEHS